MMEKPGRIGRAFPFRADFACARAPVWLSLNAMPGRKLFVAHAGELAHRLVREVARDAQVARFVRSYAQLHDRRKLTANPERLRELEFTISREALLVIAVEIRLLLPRAFGGPRGAPHPDQASLCDAFYADFLQALARSLGWPAHEAEAEAQAFQRDLAMYTRWRERPAGSPAGAGKPGGSPFPDRCAILLDPAMMEQARRAATDFEIEIMRLATRIFSQLGRRQVAHRRTPARPRRASKPKRKKNVAKARHSRRRRPR